MRTPSIPPRRLRRGSALILAGALACGAAWSCASGGYDDAGTDDSESAAADAPEVPLPGTYGAELPSASSPGRLVTLVLAQSGRAELATDNRNGQPAVVQRGTWSAAAADRARVHLTEVDGRAIDDTLVLQLRGRTLTALEYDRATWGSEGLTLQRQ